MFDKQHSSYFFLRIALTLMVLSGLFGAGLVNLVYAAPGNVTRISVTSAGAQISGESDWPTMSADGRYVAFYTYATDLVPNDTNGASDVFVRDTQTGTVTLVSVSSGGVQGNANSHDAVISADGRYVSFISLATNLVPQSDSPNTYDVFVRDLQTNTTTAVSVTLSNTLGNMNSYHQSISDDGRYIVFNSSVSNLVSGDTNSTSDVFLWDRQTLALSLMSVNTSGTQGNGASLYPAISGDGRYVVFHSSASNLVASDTNGVDDIFLRDRTGNTTTRVSVTSGGAQAIGGNSWYPAISSGGRYIAYQSWATNLVSSDTNGKSDIFWYDTQTGVTSLVSVSTTGGVPNNDSQKAAVSSDGRYVTFDSKASDLVPGDTNGASDVFVRDLLADTTLRASVDSNGAQGTGSDGNGNGSLYASITPNGQYIAFKSFATNLVSGDTNATADVFVYEQELLPTPPTKTPTATASPTPTVPPVAFPSTSVLDNFNRSNGVIGSNWSEKTSSYAIASNRLDVNTVNDDEIYWAPTLFGIDQEVYATLVNIDPSAASTAEISLMLKAQSNASPITAKLAVVYNSYNDVVKIWTYAQSSGWVQQGADISVVFSNNDVFGARARSNGQVEVYKNGTLVGSRTITSWPYYPLGGYIGLSHYNAPNTVLDDFGGGTLSGSPTLTPTAGPCSDPMSCSGNVTAIRALWKCVPLNGQDCQGGLGADWDGAVIGWPSWSAYQTNARTSQNNSRSVVSYSGNQALYPYMGSWADGCQVTALSGTALIIEWVRGADVWRETYLAPGQSHTIDLVSPEDNAMIEAPNGVTSFSVSLSNCNPQPLSGPTFTPTSSPTVTNTFTASPTPTFTATATQTFTPTATRTPTSTITNTPTFTATATYTATSSPTPTFTYTPTYTATNTPTNTATFTPTLTYTATSSPTPTFTYTPTYTATNTPTNTATFTPTSTYTATSSPTQTFTATNTATATSTNVPTSTHTATYTPSASPTLTFTATNTATYTPTNVATSTHTATYTPSASPTPTFTATRTPTYTPTATQTPTLTATATFTATPQPTKTKKLNQTPLPTIPPRQSAVIVPASLTTQSGSISGLLSSLNMIQQNGTEDNPSAYVKFQTPGSAYMGYKSFYLPANAQAGKISSMLLQVNFKTATSAQVWTWSAYDWTTGNWVRVGDSLGSQSNEWNIYLFRIESIARYVSSRGEIRIRLQSSDQTEDIKIDYQAIHITYEPVEPTPTPVIPTSIPTKPKYTFPATYTPTITPTTTP